MISPKLPGMSSKRAALPVMLATALILLIGLHCRLPGQPGSPEFLCRPDLTGQRGGNLIVAVDSDPATYNRMFSSSLAHITIAERLSADLVHYSRIDFELEPSLASSWEVGKDGRSYTLHLRKGVKFSDGSPFGADDVIFSFQALQDPKSEAVLAGQVMVDGTFPSWAKIDSHTVRVTFPRPVGMGLRALDSVPIVPRQRLLKAYQEGTFSRSMGPSASPGEVIGLGPFRLKEYQRGIKVVLERNPHYWKTDKSGQQLPYLDSITFLIIPDRNAEALRFRAGELHLPSSLNAENYALLRRNQSKAPYALRELGAGLVMDFLWFNLNVGQNLAGKPRVDPEKLALFQRPEFRRAVSFALDRDGMTRSIVLGLGSPQYGPISTGNKTWFFTDLNRTAYNLAQARSLLDQIGLKDTDADGVLEFGAARRPLEITLSTVRGNIAREKMAQIIRDNLQKAGIAVNVQLLLPNELVARFLDSFDYEAVLFGLTPTDVAPDLQTDLWYSSSKNHFWHPAQPKPQTSWEAEIDELISQLTRSVDPATRLRACHKIQQIWAREMPAIPTIAPYVLVGWNNKVGNARPSILAPHLLWNAEELTLAGK
jgi:peptide/nickel transport system substrate-binding protein